MQETLLPCLVGIGDHFHVEPRVADLLDDNFFQFHSFHGQRQAEHKSGKMREAKRH